MKRQNVRPTGKHVRSDGGRV